MGPYESVPPGPRIVTVKDAGGKDDKGKPLHEDCAHAVLPGGPTGHSFIENRLVQTSPATPDEALAAARKVLPGAQPIGMQLPGGDGAPYAVQMEAPGIEPSVPPVTVSFGGRSPNVVRIDDPRTYSMSERVLNVGYAMHFSLGMGPIWTFLVFLSGLLPLILAITGTTIWWKKRQNRLRV